VYEESKRQHPGERRKSAAKLRLVVNVECRVIEADLEVPAPRGSFRGDQAEQEQHREGAW